MINLGKIRGRGKQQVGEHVHYDKATWDTNTTELFLKSVIKQAQIVSVAMALHNFIREIATKDAFFDDADMNEDYEYVDELDLHDTGPPEQCEEGDSIQMVQLRDELASLLVQRAARRNRLKLFLEELWCFAGSTHNRILDWVERAIQQEVKFLLLLERRLHMATATYPPPPPYYRLYKNYIQNPASAPEPPPPIDGTYVLFGGNYTTEDVLPSLEEQGVRQLYPSGPSIDFKKELRSLNRELQLHILELADVLIERPSQYARRVEDISLIFKNLHHLLNQLRPHQARATLIHVLELQIQRRKQAVEDIKRRREEAQRLLKEALGTLDGH